MNSMSKWCLHVLVILTITVLLAGCTQVPMPEAQSPEPATKSPEQVTSIPAPPGPEAEEPPELGYVFESNWWLKPQTYGMFNYWNDTDFARLEATDCTVNGYRLLFDMDLVNPQFDFKKDVDEAHRRGLKYVFGIPFNGIIDKWPEEVTELAQKGACAVTYNGSEAIQRGEENFYNFSTNHPAWQEALIRQAKGVVDAGADGLAVIDPWGSSFYAAYGGKPDFSRVSIEGFRDYLKGKYSPDELLAEGIAEINKFDYLDYLHSRGVLESELESAPLYQDYISFQRQSILEFFKRFAGSVKGHAATKGITDFPIALANHGEWLVPLTLDLLPYADFVFTNLDYESAMGVYDSAYLYHLHISATNAPLVAAPMDASLYSIIQNSDRPQDYISMKIVEAYANKGAFHDQVNAGFVEYTVGAEVVKRLNSFYLDNKDLFNLGSKSLANVGILFSDEAATSLGSEHWSRFKQVGNTLTSSHFQYDVIFSGSSAANDVSLEKLQHYKVLVLPGNGKLDDDIVALLSEYLTMGGKMIIIRSAEGNVSLPDQESCVFLEWAPSGPIEKVEKRDLVNTLERMLGDGRVSKDTLPETVGIQMWLVDSKVVVHLVNYDFDASQGIVDKENIPISLAPDLPWKPTSVRLFSPDLDNGSLELGYTWVEPSLQFVVPHLKTWVTVVIE